MKPPTLSVARPISGSAEWKPKGSLGLPLPALLQGSVGIAAAWRPQWLVDPSWFAQDRLHRRHRAMIKAHKPTPVGLTAIATELLGFVWEHAPALRTCDLKVAS